MAGKRPFTESTFYAELAPLCDRHGLELVHRGNHHYQIKGGVVLVNYYPGSAKKSCYLAGSGAGRQRLDSRRRPSRGARHADGAAPRLSPGREAQG